MEVSRTDILSSVRDICIVRFVGVWPVMVGWEFSFIHSIAIWECDQCSGSECEAESACKVGPVSQREEGKGGERTRTSSQLDILR